MAEITYNISIENTYTDLKGGATFTATITRNETPPSGSYPVSADIRFTSVTVYSAREPYLQFGDYFITEGQPQSNAEFVKVDIDHLSSSIWDISSKEVTVTVKGQSSSVNAMNFRSSSATQVVYYDQNYSKTTASLSPSSLDAGSEMTVNLSNANISSMYHKITWSLGTYSNTITTSTGATSASYTIPQAWINAIPSSTSGSGTITIESYGNSSLIGSSSYSFTLTVPSSVIPTIGSIAASRIDNSVPSSQGLYVQNKSGVSQTAANASGAYGSTISSYSFSGVSSSGSQIFSSVQSSNTATISTISAGGSVTFSVYATDTRGRKSVTKSISITVTEYSVPVFTASSAMRSNQAGSATEEGTYIRALVNATYSSVGGKNQISSIVAEYRKNGEANWTSGASGMSLNTYYTFGGGTIDPASSYQVRFKITDVFGTVEKIIDLGTSPIPFFLRNNGVGVGIGKICEGDNRLDINPEWAIVYGNFSLHPVWYGTQPLNPVEGLIWLEGK